MPDAKDAVTVGPGEGVTIQGPAGGPLTFKVRGHQTGGVLTALENVVAPGDGPPLHIHANEDESWYVLEGRLRFRLGDERSDAPHGSFVFVPRGVPHCFQNVGEAPARILVAFTRRGWRRSSTASPNCPTGPSTRTSSGASAPTSG
jgi:mannose-6-phosphate isomerase-like protein (cupin superfamily)